MSSRETCDARDTFYGYIRSLDHDGIDLEELPMNPRAVRILLLVSALALLSAAATFAGDGRSCSGWCSDLVDPATGEAMRLQRAGYEIDVFGAVVSGRLVQEFTNDAAAVDAVFAA